MSIFFFFFSRDKKLRIMLKSKQRIHLLQKSLIQYTVKYKLQTKHVGYKQNEPYRAQYKHQTHHGREENAK